MKKYDVYYYEYAFNDGCFEKIHIDTIYLANNEKMKYGIKHATLDHDLYKVLEDLGRGTWELTSEHTKSFYRIVLSEK